MSPRSADPETRILTKKNKNMFAFTNAHMLEAAQGASSGALSKEARVLKAAQSASSVTYILIFLSDCVITGIGEDIENGRIKKQ